LLRPFRPDLDLRQDILADTRVLGHDPLCEAVDELRRLVSCPSGPELLVGINRQMSWSCSTVTVSK
jgi:hypothetical protein